MEVDTRATAVGRWREILPALGINPLFLNGKHQPCPMCGGKDRARFHDRTSEGNYICGQCGAGDGFTLLQKFHSWTFAQAVHEVDKVLGVLPARKPPKLTNQYTANVEDIENLWRGAKVIQDGDSVAEYLEGRAIPGSGMWPIALRFADRQWHSVSKRYVPCMLALFQAPDGSIGTIHRTYLEDITPNKMFMQRPVPVGGAIRLFQPGYELGIAEGVETALSAAHIFQIPTWATTSERLLREWQPPQGVKRITIFGDNDENCAGHAAAYHLAHRLLLRKRYEVAVLIPEMKGADWNDIIKGDAAYIKDRLARTDLPELRMVHSDIQPPREPLSDS